MVTPSPARPRSDKRLLIAIQPTEYSKGKYEGNSWPVPISPASRASLWEVRALIQRHAPTPPHPAILSLSCAVVKSRAFSRIRLKVRRRQGNISPDCCSRKKRPRRTASTAASNSTASDLTTYPRFPILNASVRHPRIHVHEKRFAFRALAASLPCGLNSVCLGQADVK